MPNGGHPNGVNYATKKAVTRECQGFYHKATKKAKSALLDEFIRLTGYHRKSAGMMGRDEKTVPRDQ
jgi:hypothetical protein